MGEVSGFMALWHCDAFIGKGALFSFIDLSFHSCDKKKEQRREKSESVSYACSFHDIMASGCHCLGMVHIVCNEAEGMGEAAPQSSPFSHHP